MKRETKSGSDCFPFPATVHLHRGELKRIFLWVTVAVYTVCLPYVILGFRALNRNFSPAAAAKVPLAIMLGLAAAYVMAGIKSKRMGFCAAVLAAGAMITYVITMLQPNTNKHIHIPEYVIMVWLLYWALAIDYKGGGIYLLVFLCATMLGIVDELLQGIHPQRFYGWSDMSVNAAASLVGVMTLLGLNSGSSGAWRWAHHLKRLKGSLTVLGLGAATAVIACIYLFKLRGPLSFWQVYPRWLFAFNSLYLAVAAGTLVGNGRRLYKAGGNPAKHAGDSISAVITAHLWIVCPLAVLSVMQALVVWVGISGLDFR